MLAGNTADATTLGGFLERIDHRYGKANRIRVMDRGVPAEESLAEMRAMGASCLVGTPKGRLTKRELDFLAKPWQRMREGVDKISLQGEPLFCIILYRTRGYGEREAFSTFKLAQPVPRQHPRSMIVEERIYTAHPGRSLDYVRMYEAQGLAIQRPILGNLVGYFTTEVGALNQIVHMWAYEDLADRATRRARLLADPRWKAYAAKVVTLLLKQENRILVPAPFSPWANGPAY